MGLPTKPTLDYSYTAFQQSQGDNAFPGTEIDNDHANLKLSIDETIDFLTGSFRSDGILKASAYPGASDLNEYVGAATAAATAAAVSATASEVAAVAALDAFTDLYLGAKAADPALDNDGGALQDGALYWNTVAKEMRAYDLGGAVWKTLLADMAEATIKGRAKGGGTGAPQDLTALQAATAIEMLHQVTPIHYGAVGDNSTDDKTAIDACVTANPGKAINLADRVYYYNAATVPQNVQFYHGMIRTSSEYIEFPAAPASHPFGDQVQVIEDSDDIHYWPGGVGQMSTGTDDIILRCHVESDRHEVGIGAPIIATRSSDGINALYRRTIYSNFLYEPRGLVGGMVTATKFGVGFLLQDSVAASSGMKFIYTDDRFDTITEVDITTDPAKYFYPHGKLHKLASGTLYMFGIRASRYVMVTTSTDDGATWAAPTTLKDWGASGQIAEVAAQFIVGSGWVFAVRDDDGSQANLYGFTAPENLSTTTAWVDSNIPNGLNPPALEQEWGSLFYVLQARRGTPIGGYEDKLIYYRASAPRVYTDGGAVNAPLGYGVICALQENAIGYMDSCKLASGRRMTVLIDGESPLGSSNRSKSRIIKIGGDPAPSATPYAQAALSNEPINLNFDFAHWSRGTSMSSITTTTRVADCWRAISTGGIDVTRVTLEGSSYERARDLIPWSPSYALRIQGSLGGSGRVLKQRIYGAEAVRRLASKPVFFGIALAGSWPYSSTCVRAVMDINTGTGGSGTATQTSFNFQNQAVAGGLTYLGVPGYTPSVDGLVLGPDAYMEVGILFNDTGAIDVHIFGIPIIFGDRYFHPHPRSYAHERTMINQYVEVKSVPSGGLLITGSRGGGDDVCTGSISYAPKVRTPAISLGDSKTYADFRIDDTGGQELTNLIFSYIGGSSATVFAYRTGFFTAYDVRSITASSIVPVLIQAD